MPQPPIAGLFTELALGTAGMVVAVTGIFAGGARTWAILKGSPSDRVEWMTAFGFAVGAAVAVVVFILDAVWG